MKNLIAGAALLACTLSTYAAAEEIVCGEEGGTLDYEDVVGRGCTEIVGRLNILGATITNIDGIQNLQSISGGLYIGSTSLSSLDALSKLTNVNDGLWINNNTKLTNVHGLQNLTGVQGLSVKDNNALITLDGLQGITHPADIYIQTNNALESLEGLDGVTRTRLIYIQGNKGLTSLKGLQNVTEVGTLFIQGPNELTSLESLQGITGIQDLRLRHNAALTSLDGILGAYEPDDGYIEILDNPVLANISALSSLTSLRQLNIAHNPSLTSLDGLENLSTVATSLQRSQISGSAITDISALSRLTSGDFTIYDTGITDVDALSNFVEGRLQIDLNSKLTDIDGISNLLTGSLIVRRNPILASCGGAAPLIQSVSREDVAIGVGAGQCSGRACSSANGLELTPKVVIDEVVQRHGGNANTIAGCIEDYVPQTPSERVSDLIETTTQMNLAKGIANAYDSKLTSAFSALDDTNTKNDGAAFNKLYAFINSVEAQRGGKLTDSEADLLIASAMRVIDSLTE